VLLRSAPAKPRRQESFHLNFVCAFGITFAAEVRLANNILICVLKMLSKISFVIDSSMF